MMSTAREEAERIGIKPLAWHDNEAPSPVGCYHVQRLDDKWEPLQDGRYMLPRRYGKVAAFDTIEAAKAHAEADYEYRIRSAIDRNAIAAAITAAERRGLERAAKVAEPMCDEHGAHVAAAIRALVGE
jgi:hypothetical protein